MNRLYSYFIISLLFSVSSTMNSATRVHEVPFTEVKLTDKFWAPRIDVNRTVSIPSAFHQCEINGRFDNFAIAGGLKQGEHRGDFSFDDTDPYKIIEGASYSLAAAYDVTLDRYLDSVINIIASAQEADGYLTTCVTNRCERLSGWWGKERWQKINSHELYNSGHLYEAAVAHYQATGKRTLLDVAIKNADLVCKVFGPEEGQKHVPSGHPIVEMALAKLYKVTGNRRYLDTAMYFIEEAGRGTDGHKLSCYSQDHRPILTQEEILGHAVRAGYLFSGVADVTSLLGRDEYRTPLETIWTNMASKKLFVTGGIGSRPQGEGFGPEYELPSHTAYCETCAAIANVYWNHRMFLGSGDSRYYDIVERALYNGVISGVSLSGDKFFYDNPLESMGEHERAPWFGCACCPGNVTRFMASVPGYMYAFNEKGIFINLYADSDATVSMPSGKVSIRQETLYPWDGRIEIFVDPEKVSSKEFTVSLRLPGWASGKPVPTDLYTFVDRPEAAYSIQINGRDVSPELNQGYLAVTRKWKKGDKITLSLPMEPRMLQASEKASDLQGKVALQYGPVVYCLEGIDNPGPGFFNIGLDRNAVFTTRHDPELLGGVTVIETSGWRIDNAGRKSQASLQAVPYCVWNNRGPGNMEVWIPSDERSAVNLPEGTLAARARMYSEPTALNAGEPAATSNLQEAWGYNDGWEPSSSSDNSKPYHYWWLRKGTLENICYGFEKPESVSAVEVYWLDLDHYDGDFRIPESWKLYYKDHAGMWREVERNEEYGIEKDRYNRVSFTPVKTTALKIEAQLRPGVSGGVLEWKLE